MNNQNNLMKTVYPELPIESKLDPVLENAGVKQESVEPLKYDRPAVISYIKSLVANFSDKFEIRPFHLVTESEQVQNTVNSIIF